MYGNMRRRNSRCWESARTRLWYLGSLPLVIVLVVIMGMLYQDGVSWDGVVFGIIGYYICLSALAFWAGFLCGRGLKVGYYMAFIPILLVAISTFPIGLFFAIPTFIRINGSEFTADLR